MIPTHPLLAALSSRLYELDRKAAAYDAMEKEFVRSLRLDPATGNYVAGFRLDFMISPVLIMQAHIGQNYLSEVFGTEMDKFVRKSREQQ